MAKTVKKTVRRSSENKTASSTARQKSNVEQTPAVLPFGRMNYILLLIGIGIIGLGFILMSLDDFVDATQFSISLHIAPFVVVGGFVEIIYAILYKSPQPDEASPSVDA